MPMALFTQKKTLPQERLAVIPVGKIRPNPYQPRREFDSGELASLAFSIKTDGLLQPLTVRQVGDSYELIAGERRLRACIMAGLEAVSCVVMDVTERNSALLALVENIQRKDLNFFEEAHAIAKLIELYGMTQEDAAVRLGYAQSTLANKLRLLKFSDAEQSMISEKGLSERHARALLRLNNSEKRIEAISKIAREHLSVERSERLIDSIIEHEKYCERIRKGSAVFKDVRLFINTVNKAIETMQIAGVEVNVDKATYDDYLEYRITIPMRK